MLVRARLGLQQGHARLHHGGHLAGKERDVLGLDLLAGTRPAFLDLGWKYALPPQRSLDLILASGAGFAADLLAIAVLALPFEDVFPDVA